MALKYLVGTYGKFTTTGDGSNTHIIGAASSESISAITVHIVMAAASNGSIVVKSRSSAPEATANNITFKPTLYHANFVNNAIGDGTLVGTTITDTSTIIVPSSGFQIALDMTFSTGTVEFYVTRSKVG